MNEFICKNCGNRGEHHAKQLCYKCYRKLLWKPKKFTCKRCGKEKNYHGKNLCAGCYNSVFQIENIKEFNIRKYHNVESKIYQKITKKCVICGFDKVVDLHHLDNDKSNNSETNLIGLCPNHHKMLHHRKFQKEVFDELNKKGFQTPEPFKNDELFKA